MTVGRDAFVCHLRAAPSSRELLARFHCLVESARHEYWPIAADELGGSRRRTLSPS